MTVPYITADTVYPLRPFWEALSPLGMTDEVVATIYRYSLPTLSSFFSQCYDATFSPTISSLDDATTFLLGEVHDPQSTWRQLNGIFISYLSLLYPLTIFAEGVSMANKLDQGSIKNIMDEYQIRRSASNITFSGWDADASVMDGQRTVQLALQGLEARKKKLDSKIEELARMGTFDPKSALGEYLIRLKNDIFSEINKTNTILEDLMTKTFPARTQSMASALRWTNTESSKDETRYIFVSGYAHLKRIYFEPEYCLAPLFEAVNHHRSAVILIPNIEDPTLPLIS